MLQIELRADDHQRHHIQASCNFSKRFSLWDKLLGTWYYEGAGRDEASEVAETVKIKKRE